MQHYQIARYAWLHPELFLHHWGKPLFTLFASPFAQLGHWGMALFNAVCFVLTAWAADGLLRKAGPMARILFAPTLLLAPVYGTMVLAGMTEVFFGLLTMVVLRLLWEECYIAAMVTASFMPFARPEYVAFVPFVLAWVAYKRQWGALPFVLTGHVIYGIAGAFVFGDLLWAFHQDPYTGAADIYGSGGPLHFVDRFKEMFGGSLTWVAGAAVAAGAWLWVRDPDTRPVLRLLLVVGALPCLAILAVHSLLWWQGWKGSLGLLRVMATAAPLLVLCALWPVGMASKRLLLTRPGRVLEAVLLGLFLIIGQYRALTAHQPLPVPQQAYEPFLQRVGERIRGMEGRYDRLVCYHPQVAFRAELDPFDPGRVFMGWKPDTTRPALGLEHDDLLVWDAHFGPNEGGTSLELLLADDHLELLHFLVPRERLIMLGGRPFEAFLFRRSDRHHQATSFVLLDPLLGTRRTLDHRVDTVACGDDRSTWCFPGNEFPFEISSVPLDTTGLIYGELRISGDLETSNTAVGATKWVLEQHGPAGATGYWSQDLERGHFDIAFRVDPPEEDTLFKLYIYNPGMTAFAMHGLHMQVTHVRKPPA